FNGKAKLPRMTDRRLRVARPALILGVLAVILVVGWSGIVKAGATSPELAAASTETSAHVSAKASEAKTDRPGPKDGKAGGQAGAGAESSEPRKKAPRSSKHWPRIIMPGDSVMSSFQEELEK